MLPLFATLLGRALDVLFAHPQGAHAHRTVTEAQPPAAPLLGRRALTGCRTLATRVGLALARRRRNRTHEHEEHPCGYPLHFHSVATFACMQPATIHFPCHIGIIRINSRLQIPCRAGQLQITAEGAHQLQFAIGTRSDFVRDRNPAGQEGNQAGHMRDGGPWPTLDISGQQDRPPTPFAPGLRAGAPPVPVEHKLGARRRDQSSGTGRPGGSSGRSERATGCRKSMDSRIARYRAASASSMAIRNRRRVSAFMRSA